MGYDISSSQSQSLKSGTGPTVFGGVSFGAQNAAAGASGLTITTVVFIVAAAVVAVLFFWKK